MDQGRIQKLTAEKQMPPDFPGGDARWQLPFYRLLEDAPANGFLGISRSNGTSFTAAILLKDGSWLSRVVPAGDPEDRAFFVEFPLRETRGLSFFGDAAVENLTLHLAPLPLEHGTSRGDKILGIETSSLEGGGSRIDGVHLPWGQIPAEKGIIGITYRYSGTSSEPLLLRVAGEEGEAVFDFFPRTKDGNLILYPRSLGFVPRTITLESFLWQAENLTFSRDIPLTDGSPAPLTADTGTILHFPRESWRNKNYEIFRWSLFPEILYLSTADYRIQSRFFKRLAFFIEKPKYAGTLVTNEVLKDRHGWNAHDYSAEGLADFFSLAARSAFPLNPEEEILKKILLYAGLILPSGEEYRPGRGAIVGTSLETFYEQRLIFTTHEGIHGLFFTRPEFRELCESFWSSLSPREQDFWMNFLSYRRYNVKEDRWLLITEVAAYLLQQPPEDADDYFIGFITPRLLQGRPHLASWLVPFLRKNPTIFSESAARIGRELRKLYGLDAQNFHDLLPKGRSRRRIFAGMKEKWIAQTESLDS